MSSGKPDGPKRRRTTKKMHGESTPRMMTRKVRTARGRKISSKQWIERQINDPYVEQARIRGYRSRSAFKLIEIDEKFNLIKTGDTVVDLGCAPGGWVQAALKNGARRVVGIDKRPVDPVPGSDIVKFDFMLDEAPDRLIHMLGGDAPDVVLSDLAADTTGHRKTDHLKTVALVEAAAGFAMKALKPGGHFATKVFQGGAGKKLLDGLRARFEIVRHFKPRSSRSESPEIYLVAKGFKPPRE